MIKIYAKPGLIDFNQLLSPVKIYIQIVTKFSTMKSFTDKYLFLLS
ncbi:hypothetical protein PL9214291005 [Planktothrix tepida PCC 9214]|uniref:Uncharacterized protein n=1 Tax=Planktothrix tepida PCC 9214 TaxID=671072 RepID=A0A1J1LGT0_9CYAN|nr:hypothetical protein PL9214291005 [Planktothrix tepida PCC 9214]